MKKEQKELAEKLSPAGLFLFKEIFELINRFEQLVTFDDVVRALKIHYLNALEAQKLGEVKTKKKGKQND